MEEMNCVIYGRVQLVMYRDFAKRTARRLGLVGFVHNLPDGSVEVVAQGIRANLEKLLAELRKGPLLSKVAHIDIEWRKQGNTFDAFNILL